MVNQPYMYIYKATIKNGQCSLSKFGIYIAIKHEWVNFDLSIKMLI